jgi:ketosteroid isomerase-like protein
MQTIMNNAGTVAHQFDLFKNGETDKLLSMMHPRVLWHVTGAAPIPYARTYRGTKDVANFFAELAKTVTFTEFVPEKIVNADDHTVVSMGHMSFTANATGKEAKTDWVIISEFDEEGNLVGFKDYMDTQAIANAFQ